MDGGEFKVGLADDLTEVGCLTGTEIRAGAGMRTSSYSTIVRDWRRIHNLKTYEVDRGGWV